MPEYSIQRFRGGFAIVYRDAGGQRHRHALGTDSQAEARRRAPAVHAYLTKPQGRTVAHLWSAYCADKSGRAVVGTMRHTFKALADRFGPMEADSITVADCRAHIEQRHARGIMDGTIHTELGHLRMVLLWAEKQGLSPKAPYIERPSKPRPAEKHLTRDQVRALADACSMPHLRLFVHLAYGTAGRAGALLGLTWDRCDFAREKIDLEDPTLEAPHKGRAIVPMTRTIKAALLEARAGARTPFVIEWAGKRVLSVKKGLAAAAVKAGLQKVSPHMLRHSAAVRMAESGVPMEEIASYLGHRDLTVTRRVYARFSPDHLRGAAVTLELDDLAYATGKVHTNLRSAT
jgi:integrase